MGLECYGVYRYVEMTGGAAVAIYIRNICLTNVTCARSRASGAIRPTLKTLHCTTPFSSAWGEIG